MYVEVANVGSSVITIPRGSTVCDFYHVSSFYQVESRSCSATEVISTHIATTDVSKETFMSKFKLDSVPPDMLADLQHLLWQNKDVFALNDKDLGKTNLVEHAIHLKDDTPFRERYRRIPATMYEEVRKHIQDMLDIGAIRYSNSAYASPVVLVRKKDGSVRFCIDLRTLNSRTT